MVEKYVVTEIQTSEEGVVAIVPPVAYDTIEAAQSAYYGILAYAAVSEVHLHAASLQSNQGVLLESKCFMHKIEPQS